MLRLFVVAEWDKAETLSLCFCRLLRGQSPCVCVCVCADAATTTKLTSFDIDVTRVARSFANCEGRKGGLPPMDACP